MANTHSANFVEASSQYASRGSVGTPNSQFTVEFWARLTTLPGVGENDVVISKQGYFSGPQSFTVKFTGASGVFYLRANIESTAGADSQSEWDLTGIVSAGEWHHYAITFDVNEATATEKFLYRNGVPIGYGAVDLGSNVNTTNWAQSNGTLYLSRPSFLFNGDLDDVRVWNTIRSPTQVAYNWNRSLDPGDDNWSDLFVYFRLDNDWLDASGNGLHLTPQNGPTFGAPAFADIGDPELRRLPHGMVPRPISDQDAATRAFTKLELQEAGSTIWNPNSWNILNFRTGFALVEEVGVPGHINIDNTGGGLPGAHASTHENGGADEVSVAGLSGLLADPQTPATHASDHENGGADEISVAGLSGLLADGQTPLAHASSHEDGGADELTVQNLGSGGAPINKILESDGAGGWNLIDTPTGGGGGATAATGIYERQASAAIPEGDATLPEITTGIAAYSGSALALCLKVEDAVTAGTITATLKIGGSGTITATLTTGVPTKVVALAAIGAYPINFEDEITIAIQTAGGYTNAAGATTGMTIDITLINGEVGGAAQVSSTTVYGCPASLNVRDAVYLTGADAVDLADADDPAKQPLIGFVRTKPTTTTCEVLYYGELTGFTGLSVGDNYFLSETPGEVTNVAPTAPGSIVQKVGFPRNASTLVVFVDRDYYEN